MSANRFSALVRDDENGIQVRHFPTPEAAAAASAAREHVDTPALNPEEMRFAQKLAAYLGRYFGPRQIETDQIYTRDEAIVYTKTGNVNSFQRWCSAHRVSSLSRNRYSKRALDGGIRDECRQRKAKQEDKAKQEETRAA